MTDDDVAVTQIAPRRTAVIASELPGGRAVTATHRGAPASIGETHGRVRAYAHTQGLAPTGVLWEVYGHPDDTGAFSTEVFHLLA
jgi:effector-binding domain-containing protein